MAKKLATYVHVNGNVYGPDDDLSADVAKAITNPKAWGEKPTSDDGSEPPRTGKGSGVEAWREYAKSTNVDVPEDAKKAEIVAAVAAAANN